MGRRGYLVGAHFQIHDDASMPAELIYKKTLKIFDIFKPILKRKLPVVKTEPIKMPKFCHPFFAGAKPWNCFPVIAENMKHIIWSFCVGAIFYMCGVSKFHVPVFFKLRLHNTYAFDFWYNGISWQYLSLYKNRVRRCCVDGSMVYVSYPIGKGRKQRSK